MTDGRQQTTDSRQQRQLTEVTRVRAALEGGRLLHPDEGAANTVDLAQAMAALAGAPVDALGGRLTPKARMMMDVVGRHDHYVFVLIDGLGMNLVESLPVGAFLRSRLTMELRAVFPSSTAPALTSIATARWPAEHAVTGWWTHLPDAGVTATILPYVERFSERPLDESRVPVSYALPVAACARSFSHAFMMFTPRSIAGSTYSRYSTGDAPYFAYKKLADAVDAIVDRIADARGPTYSYLYVSAVDFEEHIHGPHSAEAANALDSTQTQIARLADGISGRARIVITADHGQFTVGELITIGRDDPIVGMLDLPPSGDGRAPIFHVAEGRHEAFAAAFRGRFGERFALLTTAEAESMRLFGPMALSEETRRRAGDFVGIAMGDDVLVYESVDGELRGHHGGLTPDEMRIPLILR